jgi:two-component system nitrogen regulation sensor histidine kinase GlnL
MLLLSPAPRIAPALQQFAAERSLQLVRAGDAASAYQSLQDDRFACALIDLDALGDGAREFVARVRDLRPGLRAVGFGKVPQNGVRPAASMLDLPWLAKPLTREVLARALDASLEPTARARADAGAAPDRRDGVDAAEAVDAAFRDAFAAAPHEELRRRIGQLTTLYQIGRAISESRNWSEALDYFLATLRDYLGVGGAAILLYSREATVLAPRTVLSMPADAVERCVQQLHAAYPIRNPTPEIHPVECYGRDGVRCNGHAAAWNLSVLPLLYRRSPLGFLVLDKPYAGGAVFDAERFFLQTIQTILAEEVANAVHLSKLVDLKNFNEAVLDNVESGVVTVTEAGAMPFANRLARQILGLEASDVLPATLAFDACFEVEAKPALALLKAAPAGGSWLGEALRRDGRRVPVRLRTRRIVNPGDSEPLVVVAFEDLTEQRLLEEQVRRADRLRSLGELSAAIAHEVRNPLQGISLTLANLQEHLKPGAERYVAVMFSEMQRLDSVVGGILSYARPAPPTPDEVALSGIVARALDLAAERAAKRGVVLENEPASGDDRCEVDGSQILQVVLNIVFNAIDASPPGARVRVRLQPASSRLLPSAPPGPVWRIVVHDEGGGIPSDVRDKLFDPFFTTKSDGTGLGLAVCQKIVEEHRGSIHVDSRPGDGTTFTVELPRRFEGPQAWPAR